MADDKSAGDALASGLIPGHSISSGEVPLARHFTPAPEADEDDGPPPPRHIPPAHHYRLLLRIAAKLGLSLDVRNPYETDTRPRKETRFVWIPPAPDSWVKGDWREWMQEQKGRTKAAGIVKRRKVGAYWWGQRMRAPADAKEPKWKEGDGLVGIQLHGGAYALGSAQEEDVTSNIPRRLIKHPRVSSVLAVEYRVTGFAPCPAQFLDALAGYHHLVVDLGVPPSKVVIFGDSAGGHLALALTRYLTLLNDDSAGVPRGVGLLSPWCDWTDYKNPHPKAHELALRFIGSLPLDLTTSSAYFSPACSTEPFLPADRTSAYPDTLLSVGGDEFLFPSITVLHERFEKLGIKVEYLLSPGSSHDHLAAEGVPSLFWGTSAKWKHKERERSWKIVGGWLEMLDTTSKA